MNFVCALSVLSALFASFVGGAEEHTTAMDYIIKTNVGQEAQMNVHKFDIRLPPFASGSKDDEKDAAAREETRLWPYGVVPYTIDTSLRLRPMYIRNLKKAIKEWTTYTCLEFRKRKKTDRDYVLFAYGVGCNADVGRKGDRQYVTLGLGCSDTSVIMHEIGHVVGFWHEQNRPDRNKYVDIMWDNIMDDYKFAFAKYTAYRINSHGVPYDYKSIMHYGNKAFAKNKSKPTIVAKNDGTKVFGNLHLSPLDIKQTNIIYKCPAIQRLYPKFPEDFAFSTNGSLADKQCVSITEPRKRRQIPMWLCYKKTKRDVGIHWSHNGRIPNMDCTHISSPFGEDRHGFWNDNYLCVANNSVFKFHWAKERPVPGLECLEWQSDKGKITRKRFLCAKSFTGPIDGGWSTWSTWTTCNKKCGGGYQEKRRYCTNPEPKNYGKPCYGMDYERQYCNLELCQEFPIWPDDFMFSYFSYTPYERNCIRIHESRNELYWRHFYFCSVGDKRRIGVKWSNIGPQPGMLCIKIDEPEDKRGWESNYLCVPRRSEYRFEWSSSGPIDGLECIQWLARNGTNGWDNNYLCGRRFKQGAPKQYKYSADVAALGASKTRVEVVDGGWNTWSKWNACSKTCNRGYQRRSRSCIAPAPSSGGAPCRGAGKDTRDCKITDCPKPCNAEYEGNRGRISSPNFPKYPQNTTCRWRITVPRGKRVQVKFTYMKIKAPRSTCSTDSLIIRDGANSRAAFLRRFCHNFWSTQIVHSSTNTMYLELQTSDLLKTGGFTAQWESKAIPKKVTCGGIFRGLSGTFTSPSYPNKYPNNQKCTWLFIVPLDRLLKVKFNDFFLESDRNCSYDKVEILDGGTPVAPKRTFCGGDNPRVFTAFTNRLLITFKSDLTRNYRGFKASWWTTKRSFQ